MLHSLLLLVLSSSSRGAEIPLSNANDFTIFANNVNGGTNYLEDTVYLDADITLPDSIDPIGNDYTNYFRGVFDGKGHVISNLTINPSSHFAGLFGYSGGLTITNVVLDDSCSIKSTISGSDAYIGGIIGYYTPANNGGYSNIENCVNMADITFSGDISQYLYLGGIAGDFPSSLRNYNVYVKNCVNYGSVTHSGKVSMSADLGGIVGYCQGSSSSDNRIQNCLNYGTIIHNGTTSSNLYIGGIVGFGSYTYIENCVSAGKISVSITTSGDSYTGSIAGQVDSETHINYCYFTSDVGVNSINGAGTPTITETVNSPTGVDPDLVGNLNDQATNNNWNKWFVLHLKRGSINNLTQDPLIGIQGQIPDPVKEGNSFLYWCKNAECTEKFDPESVSGITELYAAWDVNNYTVTFDFNNETTVNATFSYNTEITYPEDLPEKEGYTSSWDKYNGFMPATNITVTVVWTANNYTVTFDANGGNVPETSINVTFNETYGNLPEPNMTGYSFAGWFNESGELITNKTTVTTLNNHSLYANWTANNYTVTFNVSGGDELSDDEVTKNVIFDEEYGDLPEPTKVGYTFVGWLNENNKLTNETTTVKTPKNHTLHANWTGNTYSSYIYMPSGTKFREKELDL